MISGKGTLVLRDGREFAVAYRFGGDEDDRRAGYLHCDVSQIDPSALCQRLELVCADGGVCQATRGIDPFADIRN